MLFCYHHAWGAQLHLLHVPMICKDYPALCMGCGSQKIALDFGCVYDLWNLMASLDMKLGIQHVYAWFDDQFDHVDHDLSGL